jgi:hypothetical protein
MFVDCNLVSRGIRSNGANANDGRRSVVLEDSGDRPAEELAARAGRLASDAVSECWRKEMATQTYALSGVHDEEDDALWVEVVDALYGDPTFPARFWARVTEELPSYRGLDAQTLDEPDTRGLAGKAIRNKVYPTDADHDYMLEVGELRARQGVDSAHLMQVFRIFHDELFTQARQIIPEGPRGERVLLQLLQLISAWTGVGMVAMGEGHRRVELEMRRQIDVQESGLVRRVLFGAISPAERARDLEVFGLSATGGYYAFRARLEDKMMIGTLERYLRTRGGMIARRGLLAVIDGDVCGFVSELPSAPAPVPIGVAHAESAAGLPAAFQLASLAHTTALALGKVSIVDLSECGLYPAVLSEEHVGRLLHDRYIAPFLELGEIGTAILQTVERYIQNDGRLRVTADELFLHANTVRYRLSRYEELTGCSLRATAGLVETWWVLARYRMAEHLPAATGSGTD